jgi:hypothetical protein
MLYTKEELSKISHSLGIDIFRASMSHKRKDKTLPKEFYRNYFQINSDDVLDNLVLNNYAEKYSHLGLNCYHITDLGIDKFRKEFNDIVNYKPIKHRDLIYLKHRINYYCSFRNYRFCDDNSEHILEEYKNKYSKKYYVSHTTKDAIKWFEKELKNYFKNK